MRWEAHYVANGSVACPGLKTETSVQEQLEDGICHIYGAENHSCSFNMSNYRRCSMLGAVTSTEATNWLRGLCVFSVRSLLGSMIYSTAWWPVGRCWGDGGPIPAGARNCNHESKLSNCGPRSGRWDSPGWCSCDGDDAVAVCTAVWLDVEVLGRSPV